MHELEVTVVTVLLCCTVESDMMSYLQLWEPKSDSASAGSAVIMQH